MVVKTLRWQVEAFGRLVDYIGKEEVRGEGKESSLRVLHNLQHTDDLKAIAEQFRENDEFRKRRVAGVTCYHEILSFHRDDRQHLTHEVIEDLTREYLSLRAPNGLAFAMPHYNREHLHVHIILGGVEFRSAKTLRMDNVAFARLRHSIEEYQLERYPELEHSIAHFRERGRSQEPKQEIEPDRMEASFDQSDTLDDFLDRAADSGVDQPEPELEQESEFNIDAERLAEIDARMKELDAIQEAKRMLERENEQDRGL